MTTENASQGGRIFRPGSHVGIAILAASAAVLLAVSAYLAFFYAPTERVMGFVQKIFYFHVPAAWMMLWSAPLMAFGSVMYLVTRQEKWDRISDAAVELAVLFGVMTLVTGPLWGRKAWGVYWVWDVRLTSSLVMVMTLLACKIVRSYAGEGARNIAAGLSILAVLNAVFVYVSVNYWRGTHPDHIVRKGGLSPKMRTTFWLAVLGFHLLYAVLLWTRVRLARLEDEADQRQIGLEEVEPT